MNRNGNFCERIGLCEIIAETKVGARVEHKKKFTGFSRNGKFAVFWVLYRGITCKWVFFPTLDLYFCQLAQIVGKYIIDSLFACTVKTAIKVKCLCVPTSKKRHSLRTLCFSLCFLFVCTINRVNLVLRTSIIEDTHLTLGIILFKVERNNSLIFFCYYKHTRKNSPSFRSFTVYNSLV